MAVTWETLKEKRSRTNNHGHSTMPLTTAKTSHTFHISYSLVLKLGKKSTSHTHAMAPVIPCSLPQRIALSCFVRL